MRARRKIATKLVRHHRRLLVPQGAPRDRKTREGRAIDRVRASVCAGEVISLDVFRKLLKRI
jgi:hypothetical protein